MNVILVLSCMSVMAIAFGTAALASTGVNQIKGELNAKGFGKDSEFKLNKLAKLQTVEIVATTASVLLAFVLIIGILA